MQVYVQKSMRTTFPRRPSAVNGCELSHSVAPPRDGISPSTGNWTVPGVMCRTNAFAEPSLPSWVEAMAVATLARKLRRSWLSTLGSPGLPDSGFQERQQVGINGIRLGRGHAVRKALVGFQRAILQQLCRQWRRIGIRHDLVVIAMHHQHRHGDLL